MERRRENNVTRRPPIILTVAGSDSGGGAGIQADLKTISALGGYGLTVLTALTAQNSVGVQGVHQVPPAFVSAQMESVLSDFRPDAAKTGMLASASIIDSVADSFASSAVPRLVVDPVMISSTGHPLIDRDAVKVLVRRLFPIARIITPNLHEAAALLGREVKSELEMECAARELIDLGAPAVLLKGGHLEGSAKDYFCDGGTGEFFAAPRVDSPHTHGSGCALAAAIATFLGAGSDLREAVGRAKTFITRAIAGAFHVGRGIGPVNPMAGQHTSLSASESRP
jgi:hydroxymethylpyrimidine kinase/phosphomethylpyrimidine kinase